MCEAPFPIANAKRLVEVRHPGLFKLTVDNGTDADAIVQLVRFGTRRRVAAMFVRARQSATLSGVPYGTWQLQFQLGHGWQQASRSFCGDVADSRFDELLRFDRRTELTTMDEHTVFEGYSVTLQRVAGGNARVASMDTTDFAVDDDSGPL